MLEIDIERQRKHHQKVQVSVNINMEKLILCPNNSYLLISQAFLGLQIVLYFHFIFLDFQNLFLLLIAIHLMFLLNLSFSLMIYFEYFKILFYLIELY